LEVGKIFYDEYEGNKDANDLPIPKIPLILYLNIQFDKLKQLQKELMEEKVQKKGTNQQLKDLRKIIYQDCLDRRLLLQTKHNMKLSRHQ
jgi:hypothetical protein